MLAAPPLAMMPACRKHTETPDPLPPATQEGKNTFGCYIDGKPWVAGIDPNILDPSLRKIDAGYDEPGIGITDWYLLNISAQFVNDTTFEWVMLSFMPLYHEGEIDASSLSSLHANVRADWRKGIEYDIDTLFPYKFDITLLDTARNVCSGKFYFTAVSKSNPDTIAVTDGRFDIKYQVW